MSKNTSIDQTVNSKSNKQNSLGRRPIHKDESQKKNVDDGLQSSSSAAKKSKKQNNWKQTSTLKDKNQRKNYDGSSSDSEQSHSDGEDITKGQDEKNKSNLVETVINQLLCYKKYAVLLILSILCSSFLSSFFVHPKPVTELPLEGLLANMKDAFQSDTHYLTFRILKNALEKVVHVTEEPSAPAIFTVAVDKNAIHKSHEFLHYLANGLAPQNTVIINETKLSHSSADTIKLNIDSKIKSHAEEKRLFVVIVDNLQNIPLDSAMIFHSYCDHELAQFKQAVFLFIVPLNENLPEGSSTKVIDKAASQQLKNIWSGVSPDKIDSLITRMTVNVIHIK